jgi:hypothetical protein
MIKTAQSGLFWFCTFSCSSLYALCSGRPTGRSQPHWDAAPHNAFTDLVRFNNEWFCVFREGKAHVSPDGALRIITSIDGRSWTSGALITDAQSDLPDAKITITPDNQLMLTGAAALHPPGQFKHQSLAWFSKDGKGWSSPVKIGDPAGLWRTTWHRDCFVGYDTAGGSRPFIQGQDGLLKLSSLTCFTKGNQQTPMVFQRDDTCLCLLRRDGNQGQGCWDKPPTRNGVKSAVCGPHMLQLPDGRIVAAVRLYDGGARTSLMWLDPEAGHLTEFLKLPSGGDTSYAGLVWHDQLLWVSYYSSHEGKTSIYLAKVKLPAV